DLGSELQRGREVGLRLFGLLLIARVDRDDALRRIAAVRRDRLLLLVAERVGFRARLLAGGRLLALDRHAAVVEQGLAARLAPQDLTDGRFRDDAAVRASLCAVAVDVLTRVRELLGVGVQQV